MNAPLFISRGISFKGKAAIVSIAVSFAAMIVAVAVSAGFRSEIRSALSSLAGDISIAPVSIRMEGGDELFSMSPDMKEAILGARGVDSVREVLYKAAVVRCGDDIHGVIFRGEDRGTEEATMQVEIPRSLARILDISAGDRMLAYFIGEDLVLRNTEVTDIYDDVVTADGHMVVNCDRRMLQRVMGAQDGQMSACEVMLKPSFRDPDSARMVSNELSYILYSSSDEDTRPLRATSLAAAYPQLFDWLGLIDSNVTLILLLMTLVAAFNMIVGLLILLFEHMSTIGLLKAMGMTFKGIASTFMLVTARLVGTGILIGNVVALSLCLIQRHFHLLTLNPENYFVSFVPVEIDIPAILACDAIAFLAVMAVMMLPCRFISRIQPSTSLVSE